MKVRMIADGEVQIGTAECITTFGGKAGTVHDVPEDIVRMLVGMGLAVAQSERAEKPKGEKAVRR